MRQRTKQLPSMEAVVVYPHIHACLEVSFQVPYFEVTGHPVPFFSLGFKCPDCFIWNCSYIVYPSKMKGPFKKLHKVLLPMIGVLMAGWLECIRRALVLGLVLIVRTAIK